jgi:dienelactone hydrolase
MPAETVLAGLSMGASVAAALLGERPQAAGLLLLHNTGGGDAAAVRPALPVQLHIADPDTYQTTAEVAAWEQGMADADAAVQVFRYPGAGHLFTDPSLPDYDGQSAALTRWSPRPGSAGPGPACTCPSAGRRIPRAGRRPGSRGA